MFATGLPQAQCLSIIQGKLRTIRDGLSEARELHAWAAGLSNAEISEATGLTDADAQTLKSAMADAAGLADLYSLGTDDRNPGAGYVYGQSQVQVIGPL